MARKKINRNINWRGNKCSYVGKVNNHIVFYEGTIMEDLGDKVKCEMYNRNINADNSLFTITLPKKGVQI